MNLHGFADIRSYRVRLPVPLYPYPGRDSIEACLASEVSKDDADWLSVSNLVQFFPARFSEKNPLNVPGPIYGAETDTCCTGPHEAPNNVLLDKNGQEFVFRQASTADEFRDLVSAAICESLLRWKRSLQGEGEAYLRVYAFFVENGRVPGDNDVLPDVS